MCMEEMSVAILREEVNQQLTGEQRVIVPVVEVEVLPSWEGLLAQTQVAMAWVAMEEQLSQEQCINHKVASKVRVLFYQPQISN